MLLISGVHPPPDDPEEAAFYDVLVHETQWYAPQVGRNRARSRPGDVTVRAGHVTASLLPRSREGRPCLFGGTHASPRTAAYLWAPEQVAGTALSDAQCLALAEVAQGSGLRPVTPLYASPPLNLCTAVCRGPLEQVARHPRVHKAFGVDTRAFHPMPTPDCGAVGGVWDYLFVGMFVDYKRPGLLATKPGARLAVGRIDLAPDMLVSNVG